MAVWFREHQRATGIGVATLALILLGIVGFLGWAMFTREQPSTADLGSSSQPSIQRRVQAFGGRHARVRTDGHPGADAGL